MLGRDNILKTQRMKFPLEQIGCFKDYCYQTRMLIRLALLDFYYAEKILPVFSFSFVCFYYKKQAKVVILLFLL